MLLKVETPSSNQLLPRCFRVGVSPPSAFLGCSLASLDDLVDGGVCSFSILDVAFGPFSISRRMLFLKDDDDVSFRWPRIEDV